MSGSFSERQLEHREVGRSSRRYPIVLCLPDWNDPRNVGAAFRLADAAGLQEIWLSGKTPRPPHARLRRTARSTDTTVPWRPVDNLTHHLRAARADGTAVWALEITDRSESLFGVRAPAMGNIVLVAGNESTGVAAEVLALCDRTVHLPMHGQNSSMNVSVALGAAVYLLLMQLQ